MEERVLHEQFNGRFLVRSVAYPAYDSGLGAVTLHNMAYTVGGNFIGHLDLATQLYDIGIVPELGDNNEICNIGFCESTNSWYGWSHNMLSSFTIGSTVRGGDIAYKHRTPFEILHKYDSWFSSMGSEVVAVVESGGVTFVSQFEERFCPLGRGEWVAKTLDDARQMALDYVNGLNS